jgi:hypothetical protein
MMATPARARPVPKMVRQREEFWSLRCMIRLLS